MQVEYEDPNTIAPPSGMSGMPPQGYDNSSEEEEEEEAQQEEGVSGKLSFFCLYCPSFKERLLCSVLRRCF